MHSAYPQQETAPVPSQHRDHCVIWILLVYIALLKYFYSDTRRSLTAPHTDDKQQLYSCNLPKEKPLRRRRGDQTVALFSLGRRLGGREGAARAVERIQVREGEKEQQVREARVEHIKLKHEIQNLETILKAQGELAEGQQLMDFEHMKKENQKYSKKIDDLSEEILKLKKKVSNAVHILSQFREKLQFMEAANQDRRAELVNIETVLSQKRDILTRTKQVRDRLRRNNLKLQQKCGLLGNEILLRDFEEKMDTAELLSRRLETLKRHHAGLILTRRGIQKKIREANSSFLAKDDQRKESMEKNKQSSFPQF
ncbi:coiled-coil domain-containing protein 96 [Limosa lapponica baueri]|uniref:Coiled-coil domain-containing protein 96 n=1 Tax=Limosa lapponica baueri TaxID=1758121 RepID=A0A2I0TS44_LIMLA|nr:coiled-coil domain-containing protein 96 [Limosa lapponica baueri]